MLRSVASDLGLQCLTIFCLWNSRIVWVYICLVKTERLTGMYVRAAMSLISLSGLLKIGSSYLADACNTTKL